MRLTRLEDHSRKPAASCWVNTKGPGCEESPPMGEKAVLWAVVFTPAFLGRPGRTPWDFSWLFSHCPHQNCCLVGSRLCTLLYLWSFGLDGLASEECWAGIAPVDRGPTCASSCAGSLHLTWICLTPTLTTWFFCSASCFLWQTSLCCIYAGSSIKEAQAGHWSKRQG